MKKVIIILATIYGVFGLAVAGLAGWFIFHVFSGMAASGAFN